jgi:magnesium transporter
LFDFPAQSTGRLMTRKFAKVDPDMVREEILAHLRRVDAKLETMSDMYILDKDNKLEGVISLREAINMKPHQRVKDIMTTEVISIAPDLDQEKAARMFSRYDLLALPVVQPDGRMLGIITVDDAMDVLTQENTEDILKFGGITGEVNDQPYFTVPILRVIRHRFVWLLLLFLADTLTGNVLRIFESELSSVVALSFYIPLLIGTGGNTGAQTVSTIIRGLAIGDIQFRDMFRVIQREMFSGLILGGTLGVIAAGRAFLWDGNVLLATVIGLTVLVVCAWANTIGSLIPLVAKRIGIDPAVVSAPMISTLVDATGLFIYFTIAKLILSL